MDKDNLVLEAVRSAIAELEELEHELDYFTSSALERLYDAERLLTKEDSE